MLKYKTPPFTKGKKQLEKLEVDWSPELSIVHIHVERVISILKQKYTILQGVLPNTLYFQYSLPTAITTDKTIRGCTNERSFRADE